MQVTPTLLPAAGSRFGLPVWLSCLCCFLFGVAIILNTQPMGDGGWFWYAQLFLQGKHLYSGMHLALQPLYLLEVAATQKILGIGWLAGKAPAVVHLLIYLAGLWLLVRRTGWTEWQCAILLASIFLLSLQFAGFRFDDYHVPSIACEIFSLYLLLRLPEVRTSRQSLTSAVLLGLFCGLAFVTRANDGAFLLLTVSFAAFFCVPARKLLHVAVLIVSAAVVAMSVILLTRDTLSAWLSNSLLHAAANKGGAGHILLDPLHLPLTAVTFFTGSRENATGLLYTVAVAAALTWLLHGWVRSESRLHWPWRVALVVALAVSAHHLIAFHLHGKLTSTICALIVLVTFVVDFLVLSRLIRWLMHRTAWDPRELLLLVPTGAIISGSMSSGGQFLPLYNPIAIEFLLWALLFPQAWPNRSMRRHAFVVAILVSFWIVPYKARQAFSWHTYVERPMFTDRVWYRHPVYGPMYIQQENLAFMQAACMAVKGSGSGELLSMPFPYLNYFCNIPPWHNYVQTFFDTSGEPVILPLLQDLQTAPPEWIVYQRQLWVLKMHEAIYNQDRPLPHRKIDELLVQKVSTGEWKVQQQAPLGLNAQWYLIHTR